MNSKVIPDLPTELIEVRLLQQTQGCISDGFCMLGPPTDFRLA